MVRGGARRVDRPARAAERLLIAHAQEWVERVVRGEAHPRRPAGRRRGVGQHRRQCALHPAAGRVAHGHRRGQQAAVPRQAPSGHRWPHRDPGVPVRRVRQGRAVRVQCRGLAAARASPAHRRSRARRRRGSVAASAGVSLVLGAGNQASIPITDALDRLFIARHPVRAEDEPGQRLSRPDLRDSASAELVDRGVLRIVYGGAEVGTHLVRHDGVTDVHVTGSDKTFEAIVFGGGEEGARRKADHEPLVTKPVTGELGNVSPVIVVPGPWTREGPVLPGPEHRLDADEQRRLQLHRGAGDHHVDAAGTSATSCSTGYVTCCATPGRVSPTTRARATATTSSSRAPGGRAAR